MWIYTWDWNARCPWDGVLPYIREEMKGRPLRRDEKTEYQNYVKGVKNEFYGFIKSKFLLRV